MDSKHSEEESRQFAFGLPDALKNPAEITRLYINGSGEPGKDYLDSNIKQLINLEWLRLSDWTKNDTLPPEISMLPNLKTVQINFTGDIFDVPEALCNIKKLEFSYKGKTEIININRLQNVEEIDLDDCPFQYSLPAGIEYLPKLKHLTCDAGFARRAFAAVHVSGSILKQQQFPALESLSLEGCSGECAITESFAQAPVLRELHISGKEGKFMPVPKSLHSLKLKTLRVEFADLSTIFHYPELENLEIGYGQPGKKDVTVCLANAYKHFPALKTLCLSGCKFQNNTLPTEFAFLKNLEFIHFYNTNLKSFPKEIQMLANLTKLKFHNYYVDYIVTFPKNIERIPNLKELYFHQQIKALPSSVKKMKSLRILDLTQALPIEKPVPEFLREMTWLTELKTSRQPTDSSDN